MACRLYQPTYGLCTAGIMPPADEWPAMAWHYCAAYDGRQESKDVLIWPKRTDATRENRRITTGPPAGQSKGNGGGNCRAARFFRSEARTAPKE